MPPALPRPPLAALALAAAALVSGCGVSEPAEVKVARPEAIEIRQTDYRFEPQSLRVASGRWTIRAINTGRLPHTLRLVRGNRERARISTVLPGERSSVSAYLAPGTYLIVCAIGNHEELGMHGTLKVHE